MSLVIRQHISAKTFVLQVVGAGWTVGSLGPLIFLNFKYVNNLIRL